MIKLAQKLSVMKRICLLLMLSVLSLGYGQTIQQVVEEAKKRNITTKEGALQFLGENGYTEAEARQIARIKGIDFDAYLESMTNISSSVLQAEESLDAVVSEIEVAAESFTTTQTDVLTENIEKNQDLDSYFGYSIFDNNPFASKEYLTGNIDEGYLIAPGDELKLTVFGDNQLDLIVKVDLNGNIRIPDVGLFFASGSSFGKLKERLKIYLGRYFSGLLAKPQKSFLDVSLTQIRPVKVTVLGESKTPGAHLVSGFATVLNALYAAGGVNPKGSLREIKIYRNNKLINTLDLYDYITKGNLDRDFRLTNNDIIFIPSRLSTVKLMGEVKNEGIYELKPNETLSDLIRFSGNLPAEAATNAVNIKRITPFSNRTQDQQYDQYITSVNYGKLVKEKKGFILIDGDEVTFESVLDEVRNKLQISGNVNQPGVFSTEQYKDLRSLIVYGSKGIQPNTYLSKVDVFREDASGTKGFNTYDLASVLNENINVNLTDKDSIKVYSLEEVEGEKIITLSGFLSDKEFVDEAQTIDSLETTEKSFFWRENQSLYDLIFQNTLLGDQKYNAKLLSRIDVKRYNKETGLFQINTYNIENTDVLKESYLVPDDQIILYSQAVTENISKRFRIGGFINNPGVYPLSENMYVEDAILSAGGFQRYADQDYVVVNSENFDFGTGKLSDRKTIQVDLDYLKGITKAPKNPYILKDNDIVSVQKPGGKGELKTLEIKGAVKYPRSIVLENELNSFSSIIKQVGGLKSDANLSASYIIRNDKTLTYDLNENQGREKAIFEDGDLIYISSNNGVVETQGAVENPTQFIWIPNKRAKYYIRNSGGKTPKEASNGYVILSNKKTKKINFFNNPKVQPNSQIIVNRKIKEEKVKGEGVDNFLKILAVITSSLTTILLANNL
ncbi:SLBB domain-containing protein [Flavobacteriaceae bacterium]|nr:SLBB domain-containing protein [Flavobacteriaceae bacterium]